MKKQSSQKMKSIGNYFIKKNKKNKFEILNKSDLSSVGDHDTMEEAIAFSEAYTEYDNDAESEEKEKSKVKKSKDTQVDSKLQANLRKYLTSKSTGGLYGLTVRDKSFIPEMIKVIKLSNKNKNWNPPKKKEAKNTKWA